MWGHPFLLLRDIAVNETDQERVSDSGAIRSGLVPQLKHSAIHRRSLAWRALFYEGDLAFGRGIATAGRGRMRRRPCARSEDVTASTQDQWFLGAGRCTQEHVTPCAHRSPTRHPLDLRNECSSVTLRRLRRAFLLRLPRRIAIICARRSIAWSFGHDAMRPDHACGRVRGRQSPVATRTMASKWAFAGLGGSGYLMPARCTRGSRRCLNGWL
jgi:hypothetical protein